LTSSEHNVEKKKAEPLLCFCGLVIMGPVLFSGSAEGFVAYDWPIRAKSELAGLGGLLLLLEDLDVK